MILRIDNEQIMERLKKEYPNYKEATKADLTMFGLPVYGFGFKVAGGTLGEFLGEKQ